MWIKKEKVEKMSDQKPENQTVKSATENADSSKCGQECEVYSRVVGYFRPVQNWNNGKREEFHDRKEYSYAKSMADTQRAQKPFPAEMHIEAKCGCE